MNDRYLVGGYVRDSLGSTIKKPASIVDVGSQKQMCFLARTNLALFKKAVQVLGCDVSGNSQRQLPRIAFAGVKMTYLQFHAHYVNSHLGPSDFSVRLTL